MAKYQSPYTGAQVDSAVGAYISGSITSAINTASSGAVTTANNYTDTTVSGAVTSAKNYTDTTSSSLNTEINNASGSAVNAANVYTDARTSLTVINSAGASVSVPVLSGGYLYNCTTPVTGITVGSCVSNSLGDVVHFTAANAAVTINLPAGLSVLLYEDVASGSSYDLMVCDNRLIVKGISEVTQ